MNKTENNLVPELRFSEFINEGEWRNKKVNELGETINGLSNKTSNDFGIGNPYITYKQVFDNPTINLKECGKVNITKDEKQNALQKGDILFTTSSETPDEVGYCSILKDAPNKPTYLNSFCFALRPFDSEVINLEFSRYLFHSQIYRKSVRLLAQGSTRFNISKKSFLELKLPIPCSNEQQKIADCLSTLDEIIIAHTEKLKTIKSHKKGLLEELFPIEGTKIPALRFKEFKNDWQEIKLGQVCTYFKGFAFQSKDYISNGRRIVRVSDMGFDYIKDETNAIYIDENKAELYKRWKLKKNDLIITTVGSKPPVYDSLVGRTIVVKSKDENSLLNQNAVCIRANELIEQKFLNSLFKRNVYISFIESIIRGNANQGSIALVDLFEYKFLLPELKEQRKIAQCLSEIDNLIMAQTDKLQQLKNHKKGLMQRLFPQIT